MNERRPSHNVGVNDQTEMSIEETLRCLDSEVPSPVDDRITKPTPGTLDYALNASALSQEKTVISILSNQSYAYLKKIDDCDEDYEEAEVKKKVKHSRRGSLATISMSEKSCGDSMSTLGSIDDLDSGTPHVEASMAKRSNNDETQMNCDEKEVGSSLKPTVCDVEKENIEVSTACSTSISVEATNSTSASQRRSQGEKPHGHPKATKSLYRRSSFRRKSSSRLYPRGRSRVRIPRSTSRAMLRRGIGSSDSVSNFIQGPKPKIDSVNPPVPLPSKVEAIKYDDLLSEGQNYLAMSMLVYIYARLREMSILGYTNSEFRAIDVNSWKKYVPPEEEDYEDEAGDDKEEKEEQEEAVESERQNYLDNTKTAGSIIRVVLEELEMEEEQNEEKDSLHSSKHDISVITEFRHWVHDSRSDQHDDATETAIKQLRAKVARARWRRATNGVRSSVRFSQMGKIHAERRMSDRSLLSHEEEEESEEDNLRSSIQRRKHFLEAELETEGELNWLKLQRLVIEDHFDGPDFSQGRGRRPSSLMIDAALEDNLPNYFKPGSVLSRMMEQGIEVVYFGDRHPNEAIYCICVHRKTKTVTIVFRGSVTAHNWLYNMKLMMSAQENPLANENYDGRSSHFGLHTGFGLYMLKKRKDNGKRKMDEIFDKIDTIGHELDPSGNYRLSITGHSLGGALSTIFSFYAACDRRFTKLAPVRVFTYAAPRVGDKRFLSAYQHLERSGRLLHARFSNTHDIVPLTPTFAVKGTNFGPLYHHVGLQVKLHKPSLIGKTLLRYFVDTVYPRPSSNKSKFWLCLSNNFVTNVTSLSGFKKNHKLTEYQRRMNFAREIRTCLGRTEFFHDNKRNCLKLLEDYYRIRAHIPAPPSDIFDDTSVASSTVTTIKIKPRKDIQRRMRKYVYALLLVVIIPFGVYVMSLNHTHPSKSTGTKHDEEQTYRTVQVEEKFSDAILEKGRQEELSRSDNESEKLMGGMLKDHLKEVSLVVDHKNILIIQPSQQIFMAGLMIKAMQRNDYAAMFSDGSNCEHAFAYANDFSWGVKTRGKGYSELARSISATRAKQRQEDLMELQQYLSTLDTKISMYKMPGRKEFDKGDIMIDFNNDPGTVLGPLLQHICDQLSSQIMKISPLRKQ